MRRRNWRSSVESRQYAVEAANLLRLTLGTGRLALPSIAHDRERPVEVVRAVRCCTMPDALSTLMPRYVHMM